ncbi:MAG TPA: ABC transporter permease, partial [Bryobacteraceae bacterium]|nr:ABC transporter permease [Bryobacteraceae bacterium]
MFWRRKRSVHDFSEEIRAHLELEADEIRAEGANEADARASARKAFGNIAAAEERFYEKGRMLWFDSLLRDFRYGISNMRRKPGFTLTAVLILALGIGVNTTIFSVVNALLLRPLPVPDSGRVVSIYTSDFSGPPYHSSSYPDYLDFRAGTNVFSSIAAYFMQPMNVSAGGPSERVTGNLVTENYFPALRIEAARGRTLTAGDKNAAVISYGFWQRTFASDPDIVGRKIVVNGMPYRVAGVAPKDFTGLARGVPADIWAPLTAESRLVQASKLANRGSRWLSVVGRLRDGVDLAEAQAALRLMAGRLHQAYPEDWTDVQKRARRITLRPANEGLPVVDRAQLIPFLTILMAVVGIVLLLACVNVANLLLARASARAREIGIRLSLGASRLCLIRQFLIESVLLALTAGAAGVLAAIWATGLLTRFRPPLRLPVELDFSPDLRVLSFALAVSLATALLCGLLPAIRATRLNVIPRLRESAPNRAAAFLSLRNALAMTQVALSLILLAGAGLFLRSLIAATSIDPGFNPAHIAIASLDLGTLGYDEARGLAFYRQLLDRAGALPGVKSVSLARMVPLGLGGNRTRADLQGYTPRAGEDMGININYVSPRYFETMGIPLLQGRDFTAQDQKGSAGVAIVNEAFARHYWPGENPIGRWIRTNGASFTVVGVARTGKYRSLSEDPLPYFYLPLFQQYRSDAILHVRAYGDAAVLSGKIRRVVRSLDKDLPVFGFATMDEHLGIALLPSRAAAILLGAFGVLAL